MRMSEWMPPAPATIEAIVLKPEVVIAAPAWRRRLGAPVAFIRRVADAAHQAAVADGATSLTGPVAVSMADDAAIRGLNASWRQKDKPTNVLSFPSAAGTGGDIMLALETIAAEADLQGKSFADHTAHLVAHGILHLMGYDHVRLGQARRMERLERLVLAGLGIADPYVDNEG